MYKLEIFDGKNLKVKTYKTLWGIQRKIGEKFTITKEDVQSETWVGNNIIYEGEDKDFNKITVKVV